MAALGVPPPENSGQVSQSLTSTVLGLDWNTLTDCFSFRWRPAAIGELNELAALLPTKRKLLRMAMTLYDPLGFIAFLTVLPRIILRPVWSEAADWDQKIRDNHRDSWRAWIKVIREFESVRIPRWTGTVHDDVVELHVFANASEKAIAEREKDAGQTLSPKKSSIGRPTTLWSR